MTHVLADLLLLMILGFTVWQGYRKGFILTLAGVLVLILAAWGAGRFSGNYAGDFEQKLNPLFGWASDEAADEAIRKGGYTSGVNDDETLLRIAAEAFGGMGINGEESGKLAEAAIGDMRENASSLKTSISNTFIHAMCRALLFIFAFAVLALFLTLLAHFVSMLFKIPGLRLIDTIGGLAAGLIYGLFMLSAISWGLRFLGVLIPADFIEGTVLLRFFVNNNLLASFL